MVLRYGNWDSKYDPDYVTQVANEASSIYFVNLVFMQFFNLLAVRTRRLSIFQQPPILKKETQNLLLFPAMLFALCVVFICESSLPKSLLME
jgi:sodium/potassium-transporting ATPase subunit alpha